MNSAPRRPQAGHAATYLVPWLAGAAIVGAVVGQIFKIEPGLAVLGSVVATIGGLVLFGAVRGIYSDYAMARQARKEIATCVPAAPAGLALEARIRMLDGVESEIQSERGFGGSVNNYTALGIDVTRRRLALGWGKHVIEIARQQVRHWRLTEDRSAPVGHLLVVELATPASAIAGVTAVKRVEIAARSPADDQALQDALRRALGEPLMTDR